MTTIPLEQGKEYWLGYPQGRPEGISSSDRRGVYVGVYQKMHVFAVKRDDKTELYTCPSGPCQAIWFSDGEDDPSIPAPPVTFEKIASEKETSKLAEILKNGT